MRENTERRRTRRTKLRPVEYEITWGGDPEDASVTTRGMVTIEGLNAWVQEVLADPRYRPGFRVLVDSRQLDWGSFSSEDVRKRIELFAKDAVRLGHAHIAVVARVPVDYGMLRMEQTYIKLHSELEIEMGVFLSFEDARRWLSEAPAPDSVFDSA
jgi:hypothetical protein